MTLITQEAQKRLKDKEDLKRQQKYDLELHKLNQKQEMHYENSNAFNDKHIMKVMHKVSESDVSLDESLTRMNGNWLFNRNMKPERKLAVENTVIELSAKQSIEDMDDVTKTEACVNLLRKFGSKRDYLVIENVSLKHKAQGQLHSRDRKLRDGLHQKYLTNVSEENASDDVLETIGREITWSRICEQVNHPRRNASPPNSFFSQLRENLQSNSQNRLQQLKRSK